jgi:Mycobacterium 19 kDa lipoprotein antigen
VRAGADIAPEAARVTIDAASHTTHPAACSQLQSYRTLDMGDRNGHVEAVVLGQRLALRNQQQQSQQSGDHRVHDHRRVLSRSTDPAYAE